MRTIYDYKDIRKFEISSIAWEIKDGVIVTATSSLAAELRAYYPDYTVIGMHDLICELIPEWDDDTKDLRNYIALRNSMDSYAAENETDATLFLSLQRNATDIWNAILLLIEADVYPQDIPDHMSTPLQHFKEIWKQLEMENSTLMNLRSQFAFRLSKKESIVSGINSCIESTYNVKSEADKKRIFFLGFYFITPIQARIIDAIEETGIDIAFLNCRDIRYRGVFEIWEKTFAKEYMSSSAIDIQPSISSDNYFGDVLNGEKNRLDIDITKYCSDLDFAQAMKEPLRTGASIYTPDLKSCESIMKEYYPEYFERKHLLAFPVGQYIYYLHMMWSSFHDDIEMKFDYVFKCFATGWLEVDHCNGRNQLSNLAKLEPFFKDCVSFEDWQKNFRLLKDAKECVKIFEIEEGPNKRWHELLGNPFTRISIYNLSDENLDIIEKLLAKLIKDAKYLFSSAGKVRISDHFGKITKIINGHLDREEVLDDEIQIAKELVRNLEIASVQDQECPLNAIKDAIMLLIGGHFDEVDTLDQENALIEERIAPLAKVESSVLSNYGEDIYLVLADEFTLPGIPRSLPWPLSDELLDSLQIGDREDTKRYVACMRSVIENRPLSYRYLFYSFISNVNGENHPNLHISWVKNKGTKTASASPYLLMMETDVNKLKDTASSIDFEEEIGKIKTIASRLEIKKPGIDVPEEIQMDYSLCEYRYLYSYLVNYLPEYKSEFHYSFLLSSLIKAFYTESGKSKKEIARNLFELFPFFRPVELRQASDYSGGRQNREEPFIFDDVLYPASRLDIHYLKAKDLALQVHEGETISDDKDQKSVCVYCPYSNVCIYKSEVIGGTAN